MGVSVIIAFKSDSGGPRDEAFEFVLERWSRFLRRWPDAELSVGEDDSGASDFCKSRALNNAVRDSTGDILIIADADVVARPETIEAGLATLAKGAPWVQPFTRCERLDRETTAKWRALEPDAELPEEFTTCYNPCIQCGPMTIMRRTDWDRVRGYDERFVGWGYEDMAFGFAMDHLIGRRVKLKHSVYHLWHADVGGFDRSRDTAMRNRKLWLQYQKTARRPERLRQLIKAKDEPQGLKLDVLVKKQPHYIDHLLPVWNALPPERRGIWVCGPSVEQYLRDRGVEPVVCATDAQISRAFAGGSNPVLLAGQNDRLLTDRLGRKNIVLMHGAGFTFGNNHANYQGSTKHTRNALLLMVTSEHIAELERKANPHMRVEVVGCPKLDKWHTQPRKSRNEPPVVALAWHWECRLVPETRSAYPHYASVLPELAKYYTVIGHGHPGNADKWKARYDGLGIEYVPTAEEVFERADLLVADATSLQYEFASLGRPVVVCNAPWYRRNVDFGLRFWKHADVGVQVNEPEELLGAVEEALADSPEQQAKRRAAVEHAYTVTDGTATQRAVEAICEVLAEGIEMSPVTAEAIEEQRTTKNSALFPRSAYLAAHPVRGRRRR